MNITIIVVILFFGILIISSLISRKKDEKLMNKFNATYVLKKVEYNDGIDDFIQSEICNIFLQKEKILIHNTISKKNAQLNYSKIIACGVFTDKQISKNTVVKNGNIIGRGALGGLVLGPVGAIVGGMSGINSKTETETTISTTYYLIINYKKTKKSPTESISFKSTNLYSESDMQRFVEKLRPKINEKLTIEL